MLLSLYRSRSSAAESTRTTAPASWTARLYPTPTFAFDAGSTTRFAFAPAYDRSASAFIAGYGTGHASRDGRYVRSVVIESAASGPPTGSTAAFSTA